MAAGSKKVIYAALIGNGLISITKFIAAGLTGSSAMLSEGIHSVVDTGNQVLLLLGLKRSQLPADRRFPFGHGKEVYFWSFVVSIMIFAVGAGVSIYEGIHGVMDPHPIANPMINYVVLTLALIFEGGAWYFAFKEFRHAKGSLSYFEAVRRGKDPTMFVVLFEDSAAMLGLLVAFAGVLVADVFGIVVADGIASIVIGLVLAVTAGWLAYETKGLLIGESANQEVVEAIERMAADHDTIDHVNEVLTMHMGPEFVLVNLSVDFKTGASADQLEASIAQLDERIKASFPYVKRMFVEAEARKRLGVTDA